MMSALTREYLCKRLHYDPKTGVFIWLSRPVRSYRDHGWNTKWAGRHAGSVREQRGGLYYLEISIEGRNYLAHRLAWLYMTGTFPPKGIDHEDTDGLNNRWKNLRPATQTENNANSRIRSDNTTGLKGVSFNKQTGRYTSGIRVNGKRKHLGYFDDPEEAHSVYVTAAEKYFGEFARAS